MNQAIGLIEVKGYGSAVMIADTMVKVAAVELIGVQRARGFGWMTIEIAGDVGAVKAAVDAGKAKAMEGNSFISALVIPRPANALDKVIIDKVDYPKASEQPSVTQEKAEEKETTAVAEEAEAAEAEAEAPVAETNSEEPVVEEAKEAGDKPAEDKSVSEEAAAPEKEKKGGKKKDTASKKNTKKKS